MEQEYRRLVRSGTNRLISGVCGGIGEYLGIDPSVIRLIWVIASLCGLGIGLVIYVIAALILPEK